MRAVANGKMYEQKYPIDSNHPKFSKKIDARDLWNKIIHNAWKSAEPGVLFWDTILRESVADCYADLGFRTVSTNPCRRNPIVPLTTVAVLLAINLYSYVVNPFKEDAYFDFWIFFPNMQKLAQRIMDDIIWFGSRKRLTRFWKRSTMTPSRKK